jgi:dihydropteroate synthase
LVELASEAAQGEQSARAVGGESFAVGVGRAPCAVWGVLNVTPDSFSDGGAHTSAVSAVEAALRMQEQGAHVIDVGGESTRPRGKTYGDAVAAVSLDEELRRVLPVVEALCMRGIEVSVDTTKAEVARRACQVGARIVNDVGCGRDPALLQAVAEARAQLVLMHNRGQGERRGSNIEYRDVVSDVLGELSQAVERAVAAGVARERIWIDPGIGFAKTAAQSLALIGRTDVFVASGQRVLVGPSRKSFIAEVAKLPGGDAPGALERVGGTAACIAIAVLLGAHAIRVHDVAEMRQAALVAASIGGAAGGAIGREPAPASARTQTLLHGAGG